VKNASVGPLGCCRGPESAENDKRRFGAAAVTERFFQFSNKLPQ
jgi:hypothetical protein